MTRKVVFCFLLAASVAVVHQFVASRVEAQVSPTLLTMTDDPRGNGAVALDTDGGIYSGYARQWTRFGTTPSRPAAMWTRVSSGEIFIALQNGDLYVLQADGTLSFDSSVFGGRPIPNRNQSWGEVKARFR
jgi:hypothetical protein